MCHSDLLLLHVTCIYWISYYSSITQNLRRTKHHRTNRQLKFQKFQQQKQCKSPHTILEEKDNPSILSDYFFINIIRKEVSPPPPPPPPPHYHFKFILPITRIFFPFLKVSHAPTLPTNRHPKFSLLTECNCETKFNKYYPCKTTS